MEFFDKLKKNNVYTRDTLWFFFVGNLLIGTIYFYIAEASLKLATLNSNVSPIWPPTGFAISILFIFGKKFLPSIFLGAWLANFYTPVSAIVSVVIACGNMLEAYVGFSLLNWVRKYETQLGYLSMPISLGVSSIGAPLISATLGVGSLYFFGDLKAELLINAWLTWWVGDFIGALLIVPLALSIYEGDFKTLVNNIKTEPRKHLLLLHVSLITLAVVAFLLSDYHSLKYLLVILPLILIFTLSKNRFFIYFFGTAIPVIALYYVINGRGPFNLSSFNQNLLNLEIFVAGIVITTLILGNIYNYLSQRRIVFVLLAGWAFWGTIFYNMQSTHQQNDSKNMKLVTQDMELRIVERLNQYILVINGGRSLFLASNEVNPRDWSSYVTSLNLDQNTPGINGLGAIFRVPKDQVNEHFEKYTKFFDHDFFYKAAKTPESHLLPNEKDSFVITFIEPLEKNRPALGFDIGSEKNRRDTAVLAMRTGKVQITPAVRLVQDQKARLGHLILFPVYKHGSKTDTVAARIANFSHWVYAPFIAENFLNSVFSRFKGPLIFEFYDSPDFSESTLIYRNSNEKINPAQPTIVSSINLAGRRFFIKWAQSPVFEGSQNFLSTWIGLIGAVSVLMIALFIINIYTTGEKAQLLADKLHSDFLRAQSIVKEQEAKIAESSKMASLGEMASSIAHEINNPLTIIYGKARQIQHHLAQPYSEIIQKKIDTDALKIISTVERISRIIKGLRKISRDASADSMAITTAQELVDETLSFCQQRFQQSNIDFRINMNFKGEVFCRQTEISQVILNLLNNSYDAVLNLDEKWVELNVDKVKNNLVISITDSGRGISKEVQHKIFQPFFTTKEVGKGTGLGLSISKGIIEAHSGQFYLDEKCPNTRFTIEIPLNVTPISSGQAA